MIKISIFFYKSIIKQKIKIPFQENYLKKTLESENLKLNIIYTNKIKYIKDTKMAEFNYKVLYCILSRFDNLNKWKILEYDSFPLCHVKLNIVHLLFSYIKAKEI